MNDQAELTKVKRIKQHKQLLITTNV